MTSALPNKRYVERSMTKARVSSPPLSKGANIPFGPTDGALPVANRDESVRGPKALRDPVRSQQPSAAGWEQCNRHSPSD